MDITGDGIVDIVAGEYSGKITLYKGAADGGFEPPVEIKQTIDIKDNSIFFKYLFTNPTFGDFNGDGLLDAFVGGAKGMRYMINEGTKEMPVYGERKPLLDVNGNQIGHKVFTAEEISDYASKFENNSSMSTSDFKTYVYFIDWDGDGVNDIISTSSYSGGVEAINFHKGVKTESGIRFEELVPLFTAKDGGKSLPGTILIPYFYDINGDGALDILLGVSLLCNGDKIIDEDIVYTKGKPEMSKDAKTKTKGFVMVFMSDKKYK